MGSGRVIYLTQVRLMLESERAVDECARYGEPVPRRVCTQLLAEPNRYTLWHGRHEIRMGSVAHARVRERQVLALRAFTLEQVHRAALVRYLRDYRVVGAAREQTLREFHRIVDTRDAALAEHREYLLATSSQISSVELLELVGDTRGIELLRDYERAYGQFFSMFCERSRARQSREPYLLSSLLPEVRGVATRLRRRILEGESPPARVFAARLRPREYMPTLAVQSAKLVRLPQRT
jgi:hypothetical protein